MKLCKDCKFCSYKEPSAIKKLFGFLLPPNGLEYSKCTHEKSCNRNIIVRDDLVTGEPMKIDLTDYSYCATMRSIEGSKCCGEEGRYWESK